MLKKRIDQISKRVKTRKVTAFMGERDVAVFNTCELLLDAIGYMLNQKDWTDEEKVKIYKFIERKEK